MYVQGLFTMTKADNLCHYHLCMYPISHLHKHCRMYIPYTDQCTTFKYQGKLHIAKLNSMAVCDYNH